MNRTPSVLNTTHAPATLDPDIRDFIRITGEAYSLYGQGVEKTPVTARQIAEQVRAPWVEGGPVMHETTKHRIPTPHGDVRIRIYRPLAGGQQPALIYLHGGGWVMFSLDTHDRIMREYAQRAGVCVIGIDYALSPEARFPVALEQIIAVVQHLHAQAETFGLDADRLTIGGDSAGANLSLSTAIALRDAGNAQFLKGLVLNYGAFGIEMSAEDIRRYGGPDYMLTADEMAYFWSQYLQSAENNRNPLAVPLLADFNALPPVFLCIPECDVLTGQSLELQERLTLAGVSTEAKIYRGASHSFLEAVSMSSLAAQAFEDAAQWLTSRV
jgi:acetyl esterase